MEKTIPIEVVLQDPNDPIVPTPDTPSGTDTTEGTISGTTDNTNVSVPNTGDGTETSVGNNNTNFASSSAAGVTIATTAILILAIVAAIAVVVRRYYKRKTTSSGMTRQEKKAMAATSTIAVLALTVLLGQLIVAGVVSPIATNAATDDTTGTDLTVADKIQIVANRYDDVTIVATTKNISYATTDTSFGYKIFMSMAGETANLYLDGDETSEYFFAPTTRAGLDNNTWGYNFDGEADYAAMPLASDPLMAQQNQEAVSDEEFTVYYTMKADKDMPFGVYSGEITYTIEGYNGFPSTLTSMQEMTPEICEAVYTPSGTETVVPTAVLTDARDQKIYEIAKLADGNCWMTQNLDLDLNSQTALTPENTNISSNWTPANSTISFTGTTVDGWQYHYNVPYSADPGDVYYYSSGDTSNDTQYTSLEACQAEHPDCSAKNHAGNYYNWSAAVANNNTSSVTEQFNNAEGSICPAGWRLPTGPNANDVNYSDMANLVANNNIIEDTIHENCGGACNYYNYLEGGFNKIRTAPLWLARSGYVYNGSLRGAGDDGDYWSSTVYDSRGAYHLEFGSGYVYPAFNDSRGLGFSIRCVAE